MQHDRDRDRNRTRAHEPISGVDVAPLVDLIRVLLVVFLVTTPVLVVRSLTHGPSTTATEVR